MNRFVIKVTGLYIFSVVIADLHTLVAWNWPETHELKYNLWIDKSYHEPLSTVWYLYELEDLLAKVIRAYILSLMAYLYSLRLYKISLVFMAYFITQFGFYLWNRNTQAYSNLIVYGYMVLVLIFLLIPERAKVVKM